MQVFSEKSQARDWVRQAVCQGSTVGLVPTMGALHEGHFSLVRESRAKCDKTLATIFVNPTQFGPSEDLSRYPRTLDDDLRGLESIGTDAVFVPDEGSMYGPLHSTYVTPPEVAQGYEGAVRPGHFRGVATVVLKLFNILPVTDAFFGQKDFQQAAVIRAMMQDLDLDIRMHVCPIVRDADGLALSSRNRYLSVEHRSRALGIWKSLCVAESMIQKGEHRTSVVIAEMRSVLHDAGAEGIDYVAVADPQTLIAKESIDAPVVVMVAARFGGTRLLDNHLISP